MSLADYTQLLVGILLGRIVFVVVFITGIVVAIRRSHRHPTISRRALIGFSLLLLNSFSGIAYRLWQYEASSLGWTLTQSMRVDIAYGLIQQTVAVVGYGYLIAAIFGCRDFDRSALITPMVRKNASPTPPALGGGQAEPSPSGSERRFPVE